MLSYVHIIWNWLFKIPSDLWWIETEGRIDQVVQVGRQWRVSYHASFWTARSYKYIELNPGDWVKIIHRKGLTLWIEPLEADKR